MHATRTIRLLGAGVATAAMIMGAGTAAGSTLAPSTTQAEIDRVMARQPGGVQVSDNAVVWGDADVVLVVPSPGRATAPDGLGSGVRRDRLTSPAMRGLAGSSEQVSSATAAATHGCPGGRLVKDYYCFYQYADFGGRRLQFTGDTKAADASDWGFDNGTTSWVSNDVDCTVRAYNPRRPKNLGNYMWRQPENSVSRYVGSTNDNKMSFWTCNGDG